MTAVMPASVASTRLTGELFGVRERGSTDATVSVEVLVEALLDAREQAGWHLVVATLRGNDHSKLSLEIKGLETIFATAEVSVNCVMAVFGERPVEKGLEFSDGVVAVIH